MWRLLNPRSNRRGPWDRNDPFTFVDHEIKSSVDIGPAVLKRHSRCSMSEVRIGRLGSNGIQCRNNCLGPAHTPVAGMSSSSTYDSHRLLRL